MRLTGGELSGRILETPKGPRIRPTQDQVRAALFNILGAGVAGTRVLDLFAGSGAMGIEALSRGAAHATFVDQSPFCVRTIRTNLKNLMGSDPSGSQWGQTPLARFSVIRSDAAAAIRKLAGEGLRFDWVILDPPYGGDLARKALNALGGYAIVSAAGWVVVEHDKRDSLPSEIEGEASRFVSQRIEPYGDTALTFYRRQ